MGKVVSLNGKDNAFCQVFEKIQAGEYKDGYAKFAEDMHQAYGLKDHPKHGLLFIMAFHRGILGGYIGILKEYDELSNLLV